MNFRGCRTKPGPKIRKDQAARPLAGAEVLVAVVGPTPPSKGEGNTAHGYLLARNVFDTAGNELSEVVVSHFLISRILNYNILEI